MALDIMGLFNTQAVDPYQQQQQAFQQNLMRATNPQQFAATVGTNMGGQIAGAIPGLFGIQSEADKKKKMQQEVLAEVQSMNIDPTDQNAVRKALVDALQKRGLTAEAMQVGQSITKADEYKPSSDVGKLYADQAKYPEGSPQWNAIEARIKQLVTDKPQASTEIEKLMTVAGITNEKERKAVANKFLMAKLQADKGDPTAMAALRVMQKQLDVQIAQNKLAQTEAEQKAAATAKTQGASAEAYKTNNILGIIDQATTQVGGNTAGIGGAFMSTIPGSEAVDLQENLLTIKANIGFNELTQMRKDSPTGGALGQVSDMENKALQAARASLEQKQSPAQLRKNLNIIKESYTRWMKVITGEWTEQDAKNYLESLKGNKKAGDKKPELDDNALIEKHMKRSL